MRQHTNQNTLYLLKSTCQTTCVLSLMQKRMTKTFIYRYLSFLIFIIYDLRLHVLNSLCNCVHRASVNRACQQSAIRMKTCPFWLSKVQMCHCILQKNHRRCKPKFTLQLSMTTKPNSTLFYLPEMCNQSKTDFYVWCDEGRLNACFIIMTLACLCKHHHIHWSDWL